MCKSCGCAAGNNLQLELQVRIEAERNGLKNLYARLIGAPGILQVTMDEGSGQVLVDFSPQRTSQQNIENLVAEAGVGVISAQLRALAHQHGIVAFIKRITG